jgi:hypothetical protein
VEINLFEMLPHRIVASVVRAEVNECRFNAVVSIDVHEVRYESKPKILALLLLLLHVFCHFILTATLDGGESFPSRSQSVRSRYDIDVLQFPPLGITIESESESGVQFAQGEVQQ